ncbi:hypothetical protein RS84_02207 [Microbacterium hydrocarbonoxydans]|uniref:Uncharacterized protein n=2 Tax=Microbacterium hydrocarbonoxydans TaxID=273678 RepID=A0A0M2HSE7_9MICO|nr:hypothetical protein RS84_02207 [Microbacterium hydrocarbonoxydans]
MSLMPDPRFELRKVTDSEWLIVDHKYAPHDARRTVACIYKLDTVEYEVLWLRDLPLASFYMSAEEVLADVQRFHNPPSRSTAPIKIPHRPPLAATA